MPRGSGVRYLTRPPLATERLSLQADGRLRYRFRRPWRDGTTGIVLHPHELIERLAALVPRPRTHLLTYHGILAPAAGWRSAVVPACAQDGVGVWRLYPFNRLRDHKKHWLRQARDARRTVPLAEPAIDHFQTPSGELVRREELAALDAALDRLPEQYREVITLSRLGGLSHSEIAELRGASEGATRVLLHRALARLGSELSAD